MHRARGRILTLSLTTALDGVACAVLSASGRARAQFRLGMPDATTVAVPRCTPVEDGGAMEIAARASLVQRTDSTGPGAGEGAERHTAVEVHGRYFGSGLTATYGRLLFRYSNEESTQA
jgi:hypothetical protein